MSRSSGHLTTRLRLTREQLPHIPRAVDLVWSSARGWTVAWAGIMVLQGLLPAATVTLTRLLIDGLVGAVGAGGGRESVRCTLILAALMGGTMLLGQLLSTGGNLVRATQADLVQDRISDLIHRKSIAVDLAFHDSPEYYDHLHRARLEGSHRPIALLESIGGLIQQGITLVAMVGVLVPYGIWLPALLLLGALPALYVALHYNLRRFRWRARTTEDERRAWYYYWLLTAREAAAELRLFGLGEYFRTHYQRVRDRLRSERLKIVRDEGIAELAAGAVGLLVFGVSMSWMLWRALDGRASLGDLALLYQVLSQSRASMRALLVAIQQVYSNSLFLAHLFELLDLEPGVVTAPSPRPVPRPLPNGIQSRNVTFGYPGGGRPALRDFSLMVPAGRFAAIVGPNGAGKTTVIKLLCRLPDPQSGQIELDGIDLREMAIEELRWMFTVLFQEPVHYNATIAENVGLGSIDSDPTGAEIREEAVAAGADTAVDRLPNGHDTMLGRMFSGGTDLSAGEWQRVALARAFLRQAPIVLLDEPTSAMDSWAAAEWLRRFRRLVRGRTAVIVTHRFTTAMAADVMHVVHEGQVVESGTHEDLVAQGGRYAESWKMQTRETD